MKIVVHAQIGNKFKVFFYSINHNKNILFYKLFLMMNSTCKDKKKLISFVHILRKTKTRRSSQVDWVFFTMTNCILAQHDVFQISD
jgi:hypothetical protein